LSYQARDRGGRLPPTGSLMMKNRSLNHRITAKRFSAMNSVLSLTGAAHRYRRTDSTAEIRAGER
jgi:hypothetical protein